MKRVVYCTQRNKNTGVTYSANFKAAFLFKAGYIRKALSHFIGSLL